MPVRYLRIILFTFLHFLLFNPYGYAQPNNNEQHVLVAMRMIGHQILLNSGDSVSRVLPIEKEANRYKIQFESDFQFYSMKLVHAIDSIVKEAGINKGYIVEVVKCTSGEVVYSYEIGQTPDANIIPCGTRMQPKACYMFFITILEKSKSIAYWHTAITDFKIPLAIISLFVIVGLFFFFRKKRLNPQIDPNIIYIGDYVFDKKNITLSYRSEKIELSSTEADLLFLLYTSENKTLERDQILKSVWRDEGDYVGRTLDVFISKLRKKLEADPSVKIVNVRGVGYKLILNGVK